MGYRFRSPSFRAFVTTLSFGLGLTLAFERAAYAQSDRDRAQTLVSFYKITPDQQGEYFQWRFRETPDDPALKQLAQDWKTLIQENPLQRQRELVAWVKYYDFDGNPGNRLRFLEAYEKFLAQKENLEKGSKVSRLFKKDSLKKTDRSLEEILGLSSRLNPEERLFVLAAARLKEAKKIRSIYEALVEEHTQIGLREDRLGLALAETGVNPLERAPDTLGGAWNQVMEERIEDALKHSHYSLIGPVNFSKLIDSSPELAARYRDYFFRYEIFPSWIGDRRFTAKTASGASPHERKDLIQEGAVKEAMEKNLQYLKNSDSPLKSEIQTIVSSLDPGVAHAHRVSSHFSQILPFIDLQSIAGMRVAFDYGKLNSIASDPILKKATESYFRWLSERPEEIVLAAIRDTRSGDPGRIVSFFADSDQVRLLFAGDPGAVSPFAHSYLKAVTRVQAIARARVESGLPAIPKGDLSEAYRKVLQWNIEFGNASFPEIQRQIARLEKDVQPAFEEWLKKIEPKLVASGRFRLLSHPDQIEKNAMEAAHSKTFFRDPRCDIGGRVEGLFTGN